MRTSHQGDHDGLCGLDSVINAAKQLGIRDNQGALYTDLFRWLVDGIPSSRLSKAITDGMTPDELAATTRQAFQKLKRRHQSSLRIRRPFVDRAFENSKRFADEIRARLAVPDTVVILCLQLPMTCHWSVVRRATSRSITLRDSDDLDAIQLADFGVNAGRRHIRTADTFVIDRMTWLRTARARDLIEDRHGVDAQLGDDPHKLDDVQPPTPMLVLRDVGLIHS